MHVQDIGTKREREIFIMRRIKYSFDHMEENTVEVTIDKTFLKSSVH